MKIRDFSRFWYKPAMLQRSLSHLVKIFGFHAWDFTQRPYSLPLSHRSIWQTWLMDLRFSLSTTLGVPTLAWQPVSPIASFTSAALEPAQSTRLIIQGYVNWTETALPFNPPRLKTNPQGIAIIKQFEGFPDDVDPNLREAERIVLQVVTVPLTVNQFSALVSFTYNVGEATLRHSSLLRNLNAGRYQAAAKEFDRWVYIGTSCLTKLIARRSAERSLFLSSEQSVLNR
ncbi:MAG: lysozyme [Elainella sp. Prado103]|jgi:hypothetical protein|nr:lysozyme [Elainella sp. Prado103]